MINIGNNSLSFTNLTNRRGYAVLDDRIILPQAAVDKYGNTITVNYALADIALDIYERLEIFHSCSIIFALVTGRMNYISGIEWKITEKRKVEDEIVYKLRYAKQIYDEFRGKQELWNDGVVLAVRRFVMRYLADALPDLTNFDKVLFRRAN
jgi:hypothetical protein